MDFWDIVEDLLMPPGTRLLLEGVKSLFGNDEDEDDDDDDDGSPQDRVNRILYGSNGFGIGPTLVPMPLGPPLVPGGPSGLQRGVDQAGTAYQQAGGAVALTDEKLAGLLKQVFASNDEMRAKISGIISEIETRHRQLAADPKLANDPTTLKAFQQYVDGKIGEIQQLLDNAKVDSKRQADLLAALGDEYRNTTGDDHPKDSGNNSGGSGDDAGSRGSGADSGGSVGGDLGAGTPGVSDPLAGLGGFPGGMGDPLSMLGPALAGLGSAIPGALGGAGGSLPLEALGGLAPLVSGLAGHGAGDGFTDDGPRDRTKPADFVDDGHGKSDGASGEESDPKDDSGDKKPGTPAVSPSPQAQRPAPDAAVPASAGGDSARVVQMPDGSPVTAPSAQSAAAMRAVLSGSTVTDGWKQANVDLPPPGTPVTAPVDPSHLVPGQVAQFKSREPVMYMGSGKIWLDGQLQPQSALPTADFLGWFDPTQQGGAVAAPFSGPRPPTAGA